MIGGDCATTSTEHALAAEPFRSRSACGIQSLNLAQMVYATTIEPSQELTTKGPPSPCRTSAPDFVSQRDKTLGCAVRHPTRPSSTAALRVFTPILYPNQHGRGGIWRKNIDLRQNSTGPQSFSRVRRPRRCLAAAICLQVIPLSARLLDGVHGWRE